MPESKDIQRVELKMPTPIHEKIMEYKKSEGISTKSAAILELIRLGLESKKNNQ